MNKQQETQPQVTPEQIKRFAAKDGDTVHSLLDLHFGDVLVAIMVETRRKSLGVVEAAFCYGYQEKKFLAALSTQIGCGTRCQFCTLGENGLVANLDSEEIIDELRLVLRTAIKRGYDIFDRPIKITFVQGGEPLSNRHFGKAFSRIKDELPLQAKISTIFPDHLTSHSVFDEIVDVAQDYPNTVQFQVSLNSTDEIYRQNLVNIRLATFEKIRKAGEKWYTTVPNPRKMGLSFTVMDDTPMDPGSIIKVLPPELFDIRLRAWTPTNVGETHGLNGKIVLDKITRLQEHFGQAGYTLIPGNPGNVEWKFRLAPGDLANHYMAMKRPLTT